MLDGFCEFLDGLGNADDGVECVLNEQAYKGLLAFALSVWGHNAEEVIKGAFVERDGKYTVIEDQSEAFLLCLTGKG